MLTVVCQAHLKLIRLACLQRDRGLLHIPKNMDNIDNNISMQRTYNVISFSQENICHLMIITVISQKSNKN